ncbi:MAG: ATP-binding cassette domain-containing protein [Pseudomonadota bacterium]
MSEPALIELRNVECWRGPTQVFASLSLTIGQHENVAILGPNGAGKSTLLKLLAREIYPAPKPESSLSILGESRFETRRYQAKLGLVSHDLQQTFPSAATAREAVLSGFSTSLGTSGVVYRYSDQEQETADALLDRFSLNGRSLYARMSTGQQRRCLLARALATKPRHLVLDEPLAGLDPGAAFGLLEEFHRLLDSGIKLVLATHHVHEILPQVERVIYLKAGRVEADGSPERLLTGPRLSELYDVSVHVTREQGYWLALPAEKR